MGSGIISFSDLYTEFRCVTLHLEIQWWWSSVQTEDISDSLLNPNHGNVINTKPLLVYKQKVAILIYLWSIINIWRGCRVSIMYAWRKYPLHARLHREELTGDLKELLKDTTAEKLLWAPWGLHRQLQNTVCHAATLLHYTYFIWKLKHKLWFTEVALLCVHCNRGEWRINTPTGWSHILSFSNLPSSHWFILPWWYFKCKRCHIKTFQTFPPRISSLFPPSTQSQVVEQPNSILIGWKIKLNVCGWLFWRVSQTVVPPLEVWFSTYLSTVNICSTHQTWGNLQTGVVIYKK